MIFGFVTDYAVTTIEDKIDISVYFKVNAEEEDILKIETALKTLPEIRGTEYISREAALAEVQASHTDDAVSQALELIQGNPFRALINIQAEDPNQYPDIAAYLSNQEFEPIIDEVDFTRNREAIEKLNRLIETANGFGLGIAIFITLAAALVIYNTIRLAIYSSREEIMVMRLVGASNSFIKGPYLVNGIFYGLTGTIVTLLITAPIINFMSPHLDKFLPGLALESYFYSNFFSLFFALVLFGVGLGLVSSWTSMQRYLRV